MGNNINATITNLEKEMDITIMNLRKEIYNNILQQIVSEYGAKAILDAIKESIVKTETVVADDKNVEVVVSTGLPISPVHYGGTTNSQRAKFDSSITREIDEALARAASDFHFIISWDGTKGSNKITHTRFAEYIIKTAGEEMLRDIFEVLHACPSWYKGRGITRFKMEMIYHIIGLHLNERENVKAELIKVLKDYDQKSLEVSANQSDDYRNTLRHEYQMICFAEKKVCDALNLERKFMAEILAA